MSKVWYYCILIIGTLLLIRLVLFLIYKPVLTDGQNVSFTTTLLNEPMLSGTRNTVSVAYSNIFGSVSLKLYYEGSKELHYGENVKISGKIKGRLINKNLLFSISNPKIEAISQNKNILLSLASYIRQQTQKTYASVLPATQASLLLGIVLGIKGDFPRNYLQQLQTVGVVHVIAASGMNVSMVGSFLFAALGKFLSRRVSLTLSILGICFYMLLSGLQPSIIRAGIMIIFVFLSQIFGRQHIPLYGLGLTVIGMLFFAPSLIFDIGFQLSLASTLGIMFIKPLIPGFFLEDITTTISAQIATLPILMYNFGQYGLTSIIVNALVLWTIPPLMVLGAAGACTSFIAFVSNVFILLCQPLLWFFEEVIKLFAGINLSIGVSEIPIAMIVGYYFLLFSILWILYKSTDLRLVAQRSSEKT